MRLRHRTARRQRGNRKEGQNVDGMEQYAEAWVWPDASAAERRADRYPRDRFLLATKLPAWALKEKEDRDRIFEEQLARCGVTYFDFYLLHSVEDGSNYNTYERLDCFSWALEKKAGGENPPLWVLLSWEPGAFRNCAG